MASLHIVVPFICFFVAFFCVIKVFSSLNPEWHNRMWMGPIIFLLPGALKKEARNYVVALFLSLGFGGLYFLVFT